MVLIGVEGRGRGGGCWSSGHMLMLKYIWEIPDQTCNHITRGGARGAGFTTSFLEPFVE